MNHNNTAGWKKTFFLIWIGQAFSLFGSELVQFALIWYLTKTTGSASVLAVASFVALLPRVLISPFIGALIDRWNRQRVMIYADVFIAFFTMLLAAIYWLGWIQVWYIYAIMFIRAVGSGFQWPAMQASTSLLVPKGQLSRIQGLNQSLNGTLGILAPMAAALLINVIPMYGILAVDVLTAIMAVSTLLVVVIPQPGIGEHNLLPGPKEVWRDVKEGFQYMVKWKGMLILAIEATCLNFLLNPGFTFTPLLVTDHFKKGAIELSVIEAVFSIGMIAGGLVLGAWGGFKKKIITILTGILGLAFGTGLIAVAKSDQLSLAIAGMALTGFMLPITNGPIYAIIQTEVEPEKQGRLFTLLESMFTAMMPISMLVAAPVAEWIGVRGWFTLGAIGCLIIGSVGFFTPVLRDLDRVEGSLQDSASQEEAEQD